MGDGQCGKGETRCLFVSRVCVCVCVEGGVWLKGPSNLCIEQWEVQLFERLCFPVSRG